MWGFTCVYAEYYGDGCGGGPPPECPDAAGTGGDYMGEYYRIVDGEVWMTPNCEELFGSSPVGWGLCGPAGDPVECTCICLELGGGTGTGTGTGG
jgi:hypothetical protein